MSWPTPKKRIEGEIFGMGGSCFISYIDDDTVRKGYEIWVSGKRKSYYPVQCEADIAREAQMYAQIGAHPAILRFFGRDEINPGVHALRLERAPLGSVRAYIQTHARPVPGPNRVVPNGVCDTGTCLRMCLDVAEGLAHAHAWRVYHCNLSCRNLLLFDDFRVKIADWAGSLILGHDDPALAKNMQYELSCRGREFDDRPVLKRELFALGSALCEIMAWTRPFQDVPNDKIERRYARE